MQGASGAAGSFALLITSPRMNTGSNPVDDSNPCEQREPPVQVLTSQLLRARKSGRCLLHSVDYVVLRRMRRATAASPMPSIVNVPGSGTAAGCSTACNVRLPRNPNEAS